MPLWGNNDNAANSAASGALGQVNKGYSANNVAEIYSNTTASGIVSGQTVGVFGVDSNEMRAARGNTGGPRPAHAGWQLRRVGSGGRAGRVHIETLVAMRSIKNDGAEGNTVFANVGIKILPGNPASDSSVANSAVTLNVVAAAVPAGSLRYFWQVDGGPGSRTWANVANSGVYASANGNTTSTLKISNNTLLSGNVYSVVVSADGVGRKRSANATITVS